jgi:tungstate transport system substrate-binding protein
MKRLGLVALLLLIVAGCSKATPAPELLLVTTTTTQDTGLLDTLVPIFEKESGIKVKLIAVGSGQALAMGERGEADALLTHAPAAEQKLVDAGVVVNRHQVMHNDFVMVGPPLDPAKVKGLKAADAFKQVATAQAPFISRGDDSGTDKKEKELWAKLSITPKGAWYIESGTGQAKTLSIASERSAYALTDRGTFLSQQQNLQLKILVESEPALLNIYHVMQVNPTKFRKVNAKAGEAFVTFMRKPETQKLISQFGVDKYGQSLFFPDAKESN